MNNSILIFLLLGHEVGYMLTLTITTDSDGEFPGRSSIRLSSATNDVHEVEIASIWLVIKDGKFETQAKQMLERFCAKRGMDATKVLMR